MDAERSRTAMTLTTLTVVWAVALLLFAGAAHAQVDAYQKEIPPADVHVLEQARKLRAEKRSEEAVALLQDLTRRRPDYFNAQFELALAISDKSSDIGKSIPVFERAAALKRANPLITDARVFNSLGWAYLYTGDRSRAGQAFSEAQRNSAQLSPEVQRKLNNNIGNLNLVAGRTAEAQRYFKTASDQGSRSAAYNLEVVEAMQRQAAANAKK